MTAQKLPNKNFNWAPELAYVIGLITTDGSLSKDKRHIVFTSSDIALIETFKKCLKLINSITKNPSSAISQKQSFRIQFGNVQFYNWLVKIGLSHNKTFKLRKILIPDKFFPDFLRGHLDGDGSIVTYIDYYNTNKNPKYIYQRLIVYFMSGSKRHILWLQNNIKKIKNIKGSIQIAKQPFKKDNYYLKFCKKESIILLKWVYYKDELPCLKRKYKIAKKFLKINSL
jgi:hypothetical protein